MYQYQYDWNPMPYMGMMNMPEYCCHSVMPMPQQQLESMYPRVYTIVFPVVEQHCDMMDMKYGPMHIPTREQLESWTDDVCKKVEADVDKAIAEGGREEERQLGLGGRRLLRNLITILILRELIRRRSQFGGSFNYPGGMYGNFGRYPGGYPGVYPGGYPVY
ncbi:MAG: hypothetical protein GX754_03065 [Clostridiaceae bacterium]|nr:hypothetical protein [Clostridiaceae bacterium]